MKKFYYISPLILQTLIWIPTRVVFKIFYNYKIKGLENLKDLKNNGRGTIFAVNHSSELDPIMVPASLPFLSHLMPMFYTSREKEFYKASGWRQNLYGGLLFNMWGAYNVYPGKKDYEVSLKHHIKILSDGHSVCIFPEGRKTRDGDVHEGKAGAAFLSYRTNSPIIPVRHKGLFWSQKKSDIFGRRKIEIIFGKPIYPQDLFNGVNDVDIEDYKKAIRVLMDKIKELN